MANYGHGAEKVSTRDVLQAEEKLIRKCYLKYMYLMKLRISVKIRQRWSHCGSIIVRVYKPTQLFRKDRLGL